MATTLPNTIAAVHQLDPKSTKLTLVQTPIPVPSDPEDHLIKVKATAPCLGELGWEVNFPSLFPPNRERVPGTECAGVVVTSPANSSFKPGDEIYFRLPAKRPGCLRDYTIALTSELALKPKSLGWVEAAVTPLSSLTAWQGLFEHGLLDSKAIAGDAAAKAKNQNIKVLITAAGGSVGRWAVQFAAAAGAGAVIGVCSSSKADEIRKLGATEIIDYTKQSVAEWAKANPSRSVDMVFDCIGGESLKGSWAAVKENGVLLSVSEAPDSAKPEGTTKQLATSKWFLMDCNGSDLKEITEFIDRVHAKPLIDSVVEFGEFQAAFDKVEEKRAKGKVVIKVDV